MTDKQIIKALECCTIDGEKDCFNCAETNWMSCRTTLMKQALDLINRQKAKIEKLEKGNDELSDYLDSSLTHEREMYNILADERAKAIKEFAERIKDIRGRLFPYIYYDKGWNGVIDDLVKEMTEERKN